MTCHTKRIWPTVSSTLLCLLLLFLNFLKRLSSCYQWWDADRWNLQVAPLPLREIIRPRRHQNQMLTDTPECQRHFAWTRNRDCCWSDDRWWMMTHWHTFLIVPHRSLNQKFRFYRISFFHGIGGRSHATIADRHSHLHPHLLHSFSIHTLVRVQQHTAVTADRH